MILYICAVRDRAVDAFGQPFFCKHQNEAVRSFTDEVNREGSVFYAHPDDYDLYSIGTYDDATAAVVSTGVGMLATGKGVSTKGLF